MPFATGGGGIHDDGYHTASAKRGAANGVASLNAAGRVTPAEMILAELLANKNVVNGYAGLDASTKVPVAFLYANVANGIAGLDANILVPETELRKRAWLSGSGVYHAHDAYKSVPVNAPYAIMKKITLNHLPNSTLKISMQVYGDGNPGTHALIYRNGVAVGTERIKTDGIETYVENIAGWAEGDTLELWAYWTFGDGQTGSQVSNFRILYNANAALTNS